MKNSDILTQQLSDILDVPINGTYEEMYNGMEDVVTQLAQLTSNCIMLLRTKEDEHELDTFNNPGISGGY
jgi:hypothetical protein